MGTPDPTAAGDYVLELVSVGALYSGPWEKKYWSHTRGKDRYPYPVGYCAVRCHHGSTLRMEIRKGPKGPLFMITSADGYSYSGNTPNIVWEKYVKKNGPTVRSNYTNIDGIAYFGFRNPSVQRLFRELVSNIGGTAEQSTAPTIFSSGTPKLGNEKQIEEQILYPNLQLYLGKQLWTRKRSRRQCAYKFKSASVSNLATPKSQLKQKETQASNKDSLSQCGLNCKSASFDSEVSIYSLKEGVESRQTPGDGHDAGSQEIYLTPFANQADENIHDKFQPNGIVDGAPKVSPSNMDLPTKMEECNEFKGGSTVDGDGSHQETSKKRVNHDNPQLQGGNNMDDVFYGARKSKGSDDRVGISDRSQFHKDLKKCIEDTFDHSQSSVHLPCAAAGNVECPSDEKEPVAACQHTSPCCAIGISASKIPGESVSGSETQTPRCAGASVSTVGESNTIKNGSDHSQTLHDSQPGVGVSSGSQDTSSQMAQGQELARSMMSFLLPRALPLLKTYKRRKKMTPSLETTCPLRSDQPNIEGADATGLPAKFKNKDGEEPKQKVVREKILVGEDEDPSRHYKFSASVTELEGLNDLDKLVPDSFDNELSNGLCSIEEKNLTTNDVDLNALSESIDYKRKVDNHRVPAWTANKDLLNTQTTSGTFDHDIVERSRVAYEVIMDRQQSYLHKPEVSPTHKGLLHDVASDVVSNKQDIVHPAECLDDTFKLRIVGNHSPPEYAISNEGYLELKSCFVHPHSVLRMFLISKGRELWVCVLSGIDEGVDRSLFIYEYNLDKQREECPSFLGYTQITFPPPENVNERIPPERLLQISPEGQSLILLNILKVPCCREQNINCLCSDCRSGCFDENGIKIVQVKFGYVSIVKKLATEQRVCCILVCETSHVVALEETGALHVWMMNTSWSEVLNEFVLTGFSNISHTLLELKEIQNHPDLVVGHNGVGEFGLWDISNKILLVKFSSPGNLVSQILPIALFRWSKIVGSSDLRPEEHLKNAFRRSVSCSQPGGKDSGHPLIGQDLAVSLLVSVTSDFDDFHGRPVKKPKKDSCSNWRLAVLASGTLLLGSTLDERVSAIEASLEHGFLGAADGFLYMWKLSTGEKFLHLKCFNDGESISSIAVDKKSDTLAVGGSNGRLLLYLRSHART